MGRVRGAVLGCLMLFGCDGGAGPPPATVAVTPNWITTTGGCRVWDQRPVAGEQAIWIGICVDGIADGDGRLLWNVPSRTTDGSGTVVVDRSVLVTSSVYTGTIRRGFESGDGVLEVVDAGSGDTRTTYRGRFVDGRMEGPGEMLTATGVRYRGAFHLGMKDGHGTTTYPDGGGYDGAFRNNFWDGQGTLRFGHGSSYVGEFRSGRPDGRGRGVITTADERRPAPDAGAAPLVLDGTWERGCFVGGARPFCFRSYPGT